MTLCPGGNRRPWGTSRVHDLLVVPVPASFFHILHATKNAKNRQKPENKNEKGDFGLLPPCTGDEGKRGVKRDHRTSFRYKKDELYQETSFTSSRGPEKPREGEPCLRTEREESLGNRSLKLILSSTKVSKVGLADGMSGIIILGVEKNSTRQGEEII